LAGFPSIFIFGRTYTLLPEANSVTQLGEAVHKVFLSPPYFGLAEKVSAL
jgi:hypothetical protein